MYGYSFFTDNAGVIVNNKGEMKGKRKQTVTDFQYKIDAADKDLTQLTVW